MQNTRKTVAELSPPPQRHATSFLRWWQAAAPFALWQNPSRLCLLSALCAAANCALANGNPATPQPVLCIRLYNMEAAPPGTADHARSQVTRLFATAGIATFWEESPPITSMEAHQLDPNDSVKNLLRSADRACVVVRIVPDVPTGAYPSALGFALPFARSGIDVEAIYRRIELNANKAGVKVEVVLAYVIAHEIGHVLLQSSKHSPAGIMRQYCDSEGFRLASFCVAAFLPEDSKQMREGLRRFGVTS